MLPVFFSVMGLVPALFSNRFQVHQISNTINYYKSLAMHPTTAVNCGLNSSDCTLKENNFQKSNPLKTSSNPKNLHEYLYQIPACISVAVLLHRTSSEKPSTAFLWPLDSNCVQAYCLLQSEGNPGWASAGKEGKQLLKKTAEAFTEQTPKQTHLCNISWWLHSHRRLGEAL